MPVVAAVDVIEDVRTDFTSAEIAGGEIQLKSTAWPVDESLEVTYAWEENGPRVSRLGTATAPAITKSFTMRLGKDVTPPKFDVPTRNPGRLIVTSNKPLSWGI